jgi:chromosomal replication initiation ATPase DnaA
MTTQSLPRVDLYFSDDKLTVFVNGEHFLHGPLNKDFRNHVTAAIAEQYGHPIRVTFHEKDGTTFSGVIVQPPRRVPAQRTQPHEHLTSLTSTTDNVEMTGEGFLPGEDVAVAVILHHSAARRDGQARAALTRREAPGGMDDVMLFGTRSGTLVRGIGW